MNSTPFQLARMDHFFHELEAFDHLAIYDPPAPTYEDGMTSSTSDTDLSVTSIYDPPAPTYEDGMTSSTSDTDLSVTSIYDPPAPTYEDGMTSSTSDTDLSATWPSTTLQRRPTRTV
ncbi:E3 ubiquitin-protein ligase Topors-like [Oncorhynchus masou masou]|uniref:E3 ubiquitin-protein ligase Topors-like n=1 Tax=Oncorhynchus masou masou TaxID=90313 RepID=UPI003184162C